MAFITSFWCKTCKKEVREAVASGEVTPYECKRCIHKDTVSKRAEYLRSLQKLSVLERLERIEAYQYDSRSTGKLPVEQIKY